MGQTQEQKPNLSELAGELDRAIAEEEERKRPEREQRRAEMDARFKAERDLLRGLLTGRAIP